jgi:hypothetical protein
MLKEQKSFAWNPFKIKWDPHQNVNGPFELTNDYNNSDFKAMLKDLEDHQGKLTRDGIFYWIFQNGATVGRKVKQKNI